MLLKIIFIYVFYPSYFEYQNCSIKIANLSSKRSANKKKTTRVKPGTKFKYTDPLALVIPATAVSFFATSSNEKYILFQLFILFNFITHLFALFIHRRINLDDL